MRALTDSTLDSSGPAWVSDQWITFLQRPSAGRVWREITPATRARANRATRFMGVRSDATGLKEWPHGELTFRSAWWSPDRRTVYVISPPDSARAIYAMDADGANPRRIADAAVVGTPEASPDGRLFTYTRNAPATAGVYVYDVATALERLVLGGKAR
jgi:sugar lactone lactonase YvrE